MSPRAAWRLAALGFDKVYDYEAGKAGWSASGRPVEGRNAGRETAGSGSDPDIPRCTLADDLCNVGVRVRASGWSQCIVVNDAGIVLGRLGRRALETDDHMPVEEAMTEGPSTIRPDVPLTEVKERLERQQLETALVTTLDGRLVGVVTRR